MAKILVLSSFTTSLFWFRMDMMKTFIDKGYEVCACGDESEEEWSGKFNTFGIKYRQIFVRRNGINPMNDIKTFFSIRKIIKEIKPDKIFSYQAKSIIYGGIAARFCGVKEVYPLIAGIGSVILSTSKKAKIIQKILMFEYRTALKKSKVIFFQNQDDVNEFRKRKAIKKQKIIMIPGSGVNLERFTPKPMPEKFAFLCISRLIRHKGVTEYLKACSMIKEEFPEIRCMLVGPYDSNPSGIGPDVIKQYTDKGIIEYFGEQKDVVPFIEQCSVFVLPSYREGTPKSVLEAMACERAVITTNAPGCKETVVDGENGYLVPIQNVYELYEAMKKIYQNQDVLSNMAKVGRHKAETVFDVNIVNRKICDGMNL